MLALVFVTLAALSWAFVPVFFAGIKGADITVGTFYTMVVNFSKFSIAALVILIFRFTDLRNSLKLTRRVAADRRLRGLMLLDGFLIAGSNLLFLLAISRGDGAVVTLIMNSWPVVASAFLVRFMPRFRTIRGSQLAGAAIAMLGLVVIILGVSRANSGNNSFLALVYAGGGAIGQGALVVAHQRFLQEVGTDWSRQPLWQALRSAVATVFSVILLIPVTFVYDSGLPLGIMEGSTGLLAAAGVFWTISGIFFHMGVARSENPFATIPWLLAPLLSASLVAIEQGQSIPRDALIGGAIVLSANAMLNLAIEPPLNISILMIAVVFTAVAVLSTRGRGFPDYYSIIQTLGTFFAITYGFLAARLHEQRNAADLMRLRWTKFAELVPTQVTMATPDHARKVSMAELAAFRADRDGATHLGRSLLPISETLVVTMLGLGTSTIMIFARPDSRISDLLAFLIVSAVIFSIILLWTGFGKNADWANEAFPRAFPSARVGEAIFGYLCAVAAYFNIMFAILLGPSDWPRW